jgi:hypothetical protein
LWPIGSPVFPSRRESAVNAAICRFDRNDVTDQVVALPSGTGMLETSAG